MLLFAVAFFFRAEPRPELLKSWFGRVPDLSWLWFLIFVGTLKYGFSGLFTHIVYPGFYFTPDAWLRSAVVLVAGILMISQTMLLVGKVRVRETFLLVSIAWFLLNDMADYLLGTHPPLPEQSLGFMFPAAMGMSVAFTLMAYLILGRYSREFRAG